MKNSIKGTSFIRKQSEHCIILHLENDIPAMGYSAKEIKKMLKENITPIKKPLPRTLEELAGVLSDFKARDCGIHEFVNDYIQ